MSLTNIQITQGSGTPVAVDQGAGGNVQLVKLADPTLGSNTPLPGDTVNGLDVDVTRVQGSVTVVSPTAANMKVDASGVPVPVTDNGGSMTVDAPVSTPVSVRLSNGSASVDTIPVSDDGGSLTVDAPVASPVFVRLSSGSAAVDTIPVTGNVGISGTPSVNIANAPAVAQGTPGATANAWPVKVTDGTSVATLQDVSGTKCLPVKVMAQSGGAVAQQDKTAFTEGTTQANVAAGVYNDTISSDPAEDQAAAVRITAKRALHVNVRKSDGTELGTSTAPVRTDPTGTTIQPVQNAPSGATGQTIWKIHATYGANQSDQTIHAPAASKTAFIEGMIITPTAAGALLKVYDQTNADANMIYCGMPPLGSIVIAPSRPIPLAAVNNILRFATGGSAAGDITAWGYDA